jgi:glutamate synthase domain-containing protein 1
MCGIVGLYAKQPAVEDRLGDYISSMLIEMTDRGPDSAGVAVYRDPVPSGSTKVVLQHPDEDHDWRGLSDAISTALGPVLLEQRANHAILRGEVPFAALRAWLRETHPEVGVVSSGDTIEIFKEVGLPADVVSAFALRELTGTHALGHTRMATESAVTTKGSHPFSTGFDLCLVHNGSLSNHNRLRERLRHHGVEIQTENDTEVAAGYLTWRLSEGDSLEEALTAGLRDLDGFYTFAVGTRDGFAVLRDPIACKHAVMAETDDWVAMATEFRAIAVLPGAKEARIWEPAPAQIYSWTRNGS